MAEVGVINRLSTEGVNMWIGNDLARMKVDITHSPTQVIGDAVGAQIRPR